MRKLTLDEFLDWHRKIQSVHPITQDLYDKLELKFK